MRGLKPVITSILNSYSGILFLPHPLAGLGILILLTLLSPNLGLSGLICVLSAYLAARFLGLREDFLRLDFYIYNPLLVGLSIGYFFRIGPLSLIFLALMGIFTFLLTYSLSSALSYYFRLPVLSLPFVMGSITAALASYRYSNLFVALHPPEFFWSPHLPLWLEGFLRSLGAIFFMPHPVPGLILFGILLVFSRILALLSLAGYLAGTLTSYLLTGSAHQAFSDPNHFNFVLIALATGGVFLIPSPESYLLALMASVVAVPLTEASGIFWEKFGLPAFALPFNLVTLLMLYSLGLSRYRKLTLYYRGTPERTLDYYLHRETRFPRDPDLEVPVSGKWTVWQGPNGRFTHKGAWRYALDLVITDEEGRTHTGEGLDLNDYYAYRKPIFSPVTGRVVELVDGLPDEAPGSANRDYPWGNHIIIYDSRGFYVVLAHISPGTFRVKKGDWIVKGTLLGLCGSSGYAPEPHLHIHIQSGPEIGTPTLPFVFSSYLKNGEFRDFSLPPEKETLEPAPPEKRLQHILNLLLGDRYIYEILDRKGSRQTFALRVEMAPDGTFYLTDGKARLYFAQRGSAFYFLGYDGSIRSPLRWFFLAAPKIPLALRPHLRWTDYLPLEVVLPPLKKELYLLLLSLYPSLLKPRGRYRALGKLDFEGEISYGKQRFKVYTRLAPQKGFEEIKIQGSGVFLTIRRKEDERQD